MSSKYFKLYVSKQDENGISLFRSVFSMIKEKDFDGLLSQYGSDANLLVGFGKSAQDTDLIKSDMEHLLDFSVKESELNNSTCFEFDTFTSFEEEAFLEFFSNKGVERTEAILDHSGVGETYLLINGEYIEEKVTTSFVPDEELKGLTFVNGTDSQSDESQNETPSEDPVKKQSTASVIILAVGVTTIYLLYKLIFRT